MAVHGHSHNCGCSSTTSSVHQTLDEMEFERGIWSAALSGQYEDVENRLRKGDDANARDKSGYTALVRKFVCYKICFDLDLDHFIVETCSQQAGKKCFV